MTQYGDYTPREGYPQHGHSTRAEPSGAAWYDAPENAWPEVDRSQPQERVGMVQWAGAAVSLALIVGMGVWGYKLMVRDVAGIPVIRALEGEARIVPEDPGGELAAHTGLAVNAIAAEGEAAPPPERIALAPQPTGLADEDQPVASARAVLTATEDAPSTDIPAQTVALRDNEAPLELSSVEAVSAPADIDVTLAEEAETAAAEPVAQGIQRSPMPAARPVRVAARTDAAGGPDLASVAGDIAAALGAAPASTPEIAPEDIPAGTRLVQFGAFGDPATARAEWDRLAAGFGEYLAGKSRVIEEAQSGGRTFFRLRAAGFEDAADSARFCAALGAQNVTCVPIAQR